MKIKNSILVLLNTITFIAMLVVNYASNAHILADATVADVAHKYDTLFAPADYAFIIWAVIFLLCTGFVIYGWVLLKNDPKQYIQRTGIWFIISNIANALWVICWVHELLALCVVLIFVLLFTLIQLTLNLRLELDDEPVRTIFFVWWPIAVYLGWIIAASVACVASYLVSSNWHGLGVTPATWTIIMIIVALLIYIFLNQKRNMRESAGVGIWTCIAIAVRHWESDTGIVSTAIAASIILFALTGWHAYKNRVYIPVNKIKRGEW